MTLTLSTGHAVTTVLNFFGWCLFGWCVVEMTRDVIRAGVRMMRRVLKGRA